MEDVLIELRIHPTENFLNNLQTVISEGLQFANSFFNRSYLAPHPSLNRQSFGRIHTTSNFFNGQPFSDTILENFIRLTESDTELKRDETKKTCLRPHPLKKKTVEMKQYLRNKKINYKMCKSKPELITLYEKEMEKNKEFEECSICKDSLRISNSIYKLSCCGKTIHSSCLDEWVKYKMDCPLCRAKLPELIS